MSARGEDDGNRADKVRGREPLAKPLPKRFYKAVTVGREEQPAGFSILLDGRAARTPGKRKLVVVAEPLAQAMAAEWADQKTEIDPASMELTRLVVTAIDAVAGKEIEVADDITAYAATDLVCYRAEAPEGLVAEQNAAWDPVVAWAERRLAIRLVIASGIVHVGQDPAGLQRVRAHLDGFDALALTALHVMTTLTGSAMIALAHADGLFGADDVWRTAHVDEDWQIRLWGRDAEGTARRERRWRTMQAASRLLEIVRPSSG